MHFQSELGIDIPLRNVVVKTVLGNDWFEEKFIDERTEGFEYLEETLADFDKKAAAEECGVQMEDIECAAEKCAKANNAAILTGMGMS